MNWNWIMRGKKVLNEFFRYLYNFVLLFSIIFAILSLPRLKLISLLTFRREESPKSTVSVGGLHRFLFSCVSQRPKHFADSEWALFRFEGNSCTKVGFSNQKTPLGFHFLEYFPSSLLFISILVSFPFSINIKKN